MHIGLTGGIGTGKSTVCRMLRLLKIPVFSSDAIVHEILSAPAVVRTIAEKYPESILQKEVDRNLLGQVVFFDREGLDWLEKLLHPLVEEKRQNFQKHYSTDSLIVSEIPLLFEAGLDKKCDKTVLITCSEQCQKERVRARKMMSLEKFAAISKRQLSPQEKLKKADYVITTENSKKDTFQQLRKLLKECSKD